TQREIAEAITRSLGTQLSAGKSLSASGEERAAANPDAYVEYLKGLYFRNQGTGDNMKTAIEHFQRAIALNPGYAEAYAALAASYILIPSYTATPTLDMTPKIREAADKAIALDNTLTEAHVAKGWALAYNYEWKGAEREFQQALELNSGEAATHL